MKKKDRQMLGFFGVIILVFAVFLGVYFYKLSLNKFSYAGLNWVKENSPEPYHAQIPTIYNQSLTFNYYARIDPRKNNVSIDPGVTFGFFRNTTISLNPEIVYCSGANLPVYKLSSFMTLFIGIKPQSGISDLNFSREINSSFVTCVDAVNRSVILIEKANTTRISQEGDCYKIQISDCSELIPAEEKFTTAIMAEARGINL
jgi:hypothetical protein